MSALRIDLNAQYSISRVIKGGWQLAGGHGAFDRRDAVAHMLSFVDKGITTFDCADIYTGVEALIGEAVQALSQRDGFDADNDIQIHTKLVPDLDRLTSITPTELEAIVDRSLQRLKLERLHLLQFYWWDLSIGDPMESLSVLKNLQAKGKIRYLGCTNWDQFAMQSFVDHEFELVSAQVQYSLLDQRPSGAFSHWCHTHSVQLLCYGVLAGGFLSPHWLSKADPGYQFDNRSLTKYRLIIDEFGGWDLFQQLLLVLHEIGQEQGVPLSAVAMRYMLDQPQVAAIIIGARSDSHLPETLAAFDVQLSAANLQSIEQILQQRQGPFGEVYALERDRKGPHGRIMKYNLNR